MKSAKNGIATNSTPLPSRMTIAELTAKDRQAQLNPMYKLDEFRAKGLNDCFEGRGDELRRLTEVFLGVDERKKHSKDRAYGALLFGSPGSGKSALLERWRELCRTGNHAVLKLPAEAFASNDDMRNCLMETDEWKTATLMNRAMEVTGKTIEQLGAEGAHGISETVRAATGEEIPAELVTILGGLLRLTAKNPKTWMDCIDALTASFSGGWTLAVDEAEDLDQYLDNPHSRQLIKKIADPTLRPTHEGKGGLLLAGLSDTVNTVEEYKLTRLHIIRMGALSPGTAMAIIDDAIMESQMPDRAKEAIRERWIRTLARDFHQWPHHTRCAAVAVRHVTEMVRFAVREEGATTATDFDPILEQVRTWGANGAVKLYENRIRRSIKMSTDALPRDTVALANACGGPMTESQIIALVEQRMAYRRSKGITVKGEPEDWFKGLLHGGIIEPITPEAIGEATEDERILSSHYRIAIPSMASHVQRTRKRSASEEMIAAAKMAIEDEDTEITQDLIAQENQREERERIPDSEWEMMELPTAERPVSVDALMAKLTANNPAD